MTTLKEAQRAVHQALGTKQNVIPWQTAMLGDGHGTVSTGNNMCYVRLTSNSSVIEVLNTKTQMIDGMLVRIAKTPERPLVWQVVDSDDQRVDENGGGAGVGVNYGVAAHHLLHEYLGVDQVNVDWRQITTLRVYVSSAFTVGVLPGLLPRPGADLIVPAQTLDLASHIPVSGALYVLISVDAAGNLATTDGTAASSLIALTLGDIPDTPAGNFRLAAVRLYVGQAALSESTVSNDIRDLRWPQERLASAIPAGSITPAMLENGTAANQILITGATPFAFGLSTGTLNLGAYNAVIPQSGTVALRDTNLAAGRVAFCEDGNTVSADSKLFWDNTNKFLGIGTSAPAAALTIVGALRLWSSDGYLGDSVITTVPGGPSGNYEGNLVFKPNFFNGTAYVLTERMRITCEGKVGIGTTTPQARLDLGFTASEAGNFSFGTYTFIGQQYSSGTYHFGYNARAYEGATEKLVVAETNSTVGYGAVQIDYVRGISFDTIAGSVTAGDTVSAERMRISPTGKVGIGTKLLGSGVTYSAFNVNGSQLFVGASSVQEREMAAIETAFNVSTDASRSADLILSAYDTSKREGLRIRGAGSAAAIGFYGAAPVALQTGVVVSTAAIHASLCALGLITA